MMAERDDTVARLEVALSIVQTQRARIEALVAKVAALKAEVAELRAGGERTPRTTSRSTRREQRRRARGQHGNYVIVEGDGDPCPRCGRPMPIREHAVEPRELHYRRWFMCTHADCQTKQVMPERFKVFTREAS